MFSLYFLIYLTDILIYFSYKHYCNGHSPLSKVRVSLGLWFLILKKLTGICCKKTHCYSLYITCLCNTHKYIYCSHACMHCTLPCMYVFSDNFYSSSFFNIAGQGPLISLQYLLVVRYPQLRNTPLGFVTRKGVTDCKVYTLSTLLDFA